MGINRLLFVVALCFSSCSALCTNSDAIWQEICFHVLVFLLFRNNGFPWCSDAKSYIAIWYVNYSGPFHNISACIPCTTFSQLRIFFIFLPELNKYFLCDFPSFALAGLALYTWYLFQMWIQKMFSCNCHPKYLYGMFMRWLPLLNNISNALNSFLIFIILFR